MYLLATMIFQLKPIKNRFAGKEKSNKKSRRAHMEDTFRSCRS